MEKCDDGFFGNYWRMSMFQVRCQVSTFRTVDPLALFLA